ncbi:hypothetical protein C1708_16360 [Streptomyces sp. DH-12]|uniref:hypothetical protein n=1 Tax=unclassified Streptomyces TaxID=2593676 RepID=UPI000CCE5CA0|nr:hypothetical protein [Streptomyces sp. DH-12]PNV33720.1 hypothetical protein C1708_16360 [Streptomyces sp. DH-12]
MRGRQGTARRTAGRSRWYVVAGRPVLVAALGLGTVLTGQQAHAAGQDTARVPAYAFAEDARRIEGAGSTADAAELEPGRTYRSTLPSDGKVYYRLELDDTSTVHASATAVPPPGSGVSVADGVKVTVEDADGRSCDVDTSTFGAPGSPHPVAAWAMREISPRRSLCARAGTYYVTVERAAPDARGASPDPWELELSTVSEPGAESADRTTAPEAWDSATPAPVQGTARRRPGGAGFAQAAPLDAGVWRDDIRPGQTLFYQVAVDWGRQLHVTAELGSSGTDTPGYKASALSLDLYNPVRGHVEDLSVGYDGGQRSKALKPLPPVAYENRHASGQLVSAVRFAGAYYLVAHLSPEVAEDFGDGPVPLTLRVRLGGAAQDGPDYAGGPVPPDVFSVTGGGGGAASGGSGTAGDETLYRVLAAGGIGTGSALVVGLGVWTVVARRRAAVSPG